jgi:hypothetical protein
MKKVFLLTLLCGFIGTHSVKAQSIADDLAQLSLDISKLAQMKSILSDMYKAYTIVSQGYESVKSISEGNFNLHKAFLDGLLAVSPTVQQYYKITNIINNEASIVKEYTAANSYFRGQGHFTDQELDYMSNMYTNLFNQSVKSLDELVMVITANQLRMSDAERLSSIDRIDKDVSGQLRFLLTFDNTNAIQGAQRARNANDIDALKALYGISN